MSCTPIVINSAKSLETASNQDDIHNRVSEAESLAEIELTEALQERELHLESNSDSILDEALKNQIASPTSSTTENKEILEHRQEDKMQAQSDKSFLIKSPLSGTEAWRDRRELCLLESPPDPRHSEQYFRCDTLSIPEQISLSQRRIEICYGQISEYRDCQSKRKPNSSGQPNYLEILMKASKKEIALEQQYVDFLVNLQSSAEQDVTPSGLPQEERSDCETVSPDTPRLLRSTSLAKDAAQAPVLEQLSLDELASAINKEHQLFQGDYKSSLVHAYKAGQFLLKAKSKVKESTTGRWLPWLMQNCPDISDRTARVYMQIVREWEKIEKSATVADFGVKGALKLLGDRKKSSLQDSKPPNGELDVLEAEWEDASSSPGNISTGIRITNNVHEIAQSQHSAIEKKATEETERLGLNTRDNQALNETFGSTEMNLDMKYNYSSLSNMDDNIFPAISQPVPSNLNDICILITSNMQYLSVQQLATIIEAFEHYLEAETFNRLVVESIPQHNVFNLCNKCLEFMDEQAYCQLAVEKIKFSSLSNPSLNLLNQESQRILKERTASV